MHIYEFSYDILQPHYAEGSLKLFNVDFDSLIHNRTPKIRSMVSDLEDSQEKIFYGCFCKLEIHPEIFSNDKEVRLGKPKLENPETLILDEVLH